MKTLFTVYLLLFVPYFASVGFCGPWYAVSNATGECAQYDGSPAEMIRDYQETGDNFKVIELKKINNKPVIVRVVVDNEWQITFYRTLRLCKDTLKKKRKEAEDFASKYE